MIETPNIETAYKELRPVMFGALGKLARQGFVVAPADAVDLIHDFFLERWDSLTDNFDPRKGSFGVYCYVSFVHFARPRIMRLQRLQNSLVSPEELNAVAAVHDGETALGAEHDRKVVKHAISQLPAHEKEVLASYIYAPVPSERMLADKFNVTRYRLHEMLIEALGRVLVLLDRPERIAERDWKVAQAMWRDRRTVTETASCLRMTTHQIREANLRNMRLIAEALRTYQPQKGSRQTRRNTMNVKAREAETPQALLENTLKSAGNEGRLQAVRDRAREILSVLDKSESCGLSEYEMEKLDPLWIAKVYETLSTADPEWRKERLSDEKLFYAYGDEEHQIGIAFSETLIADLPDELRDADQWLGEVVPKVEEDERRFALRTPSVKGAMSEISGEAGKEQAAKLASYGVTPLMVFRSTQAISFLLDRFIRTRKIDPLVRLSSETTRRSDSFDAEVLIDEIRRVAECRLITAGALYRWDVRVAQYKPYLFDGFRCEPSEDAVFLRRVEKRYDNLFERWRSEVAVSVLA